MTLEQRVKNIEQTLTALSKKIDNLTYYDSADKNGIRQTEGEHGEAIESNSADIEKNSADIEYIAIMSDIDI